MATNDSVSPAQPQPGVLMLLGNGSIGLRARRALTVYALGVELWKLGKWAHGKWVAANSYSVTVTGDDAIFEDLQLWLLEQIPERDRRSLFARTQRISGDDSISPSDGRPLHPGLKFFYDGSERQAVVLGGHRVNVLVDAEDAKRGLGQGDGRYDRHLEKLVFSAHGIEGHAAIIEFIKTVTDEHYAVDRNPDLLINRWGSWESRRDLGSRGLDTVFLDAGQKERIVADLDTFLGQEKEYRELDIPWHRGYLFTGPPGTGKSSLAKALANHFGLDVYYLSLSTMYDDAELNNMIGRLPPRSVLLIEDSDVYSAAKDRSDDGKGPTLAGVLNVLDGLLTPHGLVVIGTSNEVDSLDEALKRKGRFDLIEELGYMTATSLDEMTTRLVGRTVQLDSIRDDLVPVNVVEAIKQHLGDPDAAIKAIEALARPAVGRVVTCGSIALTYQNGTPS